MDGVHLGTSGWTYDHWAGVFYPAGLPKAKWRDHYAAHFHTVELNASFYRWPGLRPFEGWCRSLPEGFRMTVKASRWITHARRLRDDGSWAERLDAAMQALGPHAGVMLLQLPEDFERDDERLDTFLASLSPRLRVAVELRHPSWDHPEVYDLLTRHRAAYVVMSGAGLRCIPRATTDLVYIRWHGPGERLYDGSYSPAQLRRWAERIRAWRAEGREVWGYFNNDGHAYAVRNATSLIDLLD